MLGVGRSLLAPRRRPCKVGRVRGGPSLSGRVEGADTLPEAPPSPSPSPHARWDECGGEDRWKARTP